jgi:hypothetical protein
MGKTMKIIYKYSFEGEKKHLLLGEHIQKACENSCE